MLPGSRRTVVDSEDSALTAARAGCRGIRGIRVRREGSELASDLSNPARHQLKCRVAPGADMIEAALRLARVSDVAGGATLRASDNDGPKNHSVTKL